MTDQKCSRCGAEGVGLTAVAVPTYFSRDGSGYRTEHMCELCKQLGGDCNGDTSVVIAHISFVGNAVLRAIREANTPPVVGDLWRGAPAAAPIQCQLCHGTGTMQGTACEACGGDSNG